MFLQIDLKKTHIAMTKSLGGGESLKSNADALSGL